MCVLLSADTPTMQPTTHFAELVFTLCRSGEDDTLRFPLENNAQKRLCTGRQCSANPYLASDTFLGGFCCWGSVSNGSLDSKREKGPKLPAL